MANLLSSQFEKIPFDAENSVCNLSDFSLHRSGHELIPDELFSVFRRNFSNVQRWTFATYF